MTSEISGFSNEAPISVFSDIKYKLPHISFIFIAFSLLTIIYLLVINYHKVGNPKEPNIVVGLIADAEKIAGFKKLEEAYNAIDPKHKIKFELKGIGHGLGYSTWLAMELNSGKPRPDIVSSNFAPNYGSYVDFDFYRQATNPYTGRAWEEDLDFDFQHLRNPIGNLVTISTQSVKVMWFYNRTKFEQLQLEPPKTWDELIRLFETINKSGYTAHTLKFNLKFHQWLAKILWDQFTRPWIQNIRALPGDWCFRPEVDGDWDYDPNDPFNDSRITINYSRLLRSVRDQVIRYDGERFKAVLTALKEIAQTASSEFLVSTSSDFEESYSQFIRQEALVHLDTSANMVLIQKDMDELSKSGLDFEWDVFDTPPLTHPLAIGVARSIESAAGEYVGTVYKNQSQVDAAIDFLMFWLSPYGYQVYVDALVEANSFHPQGPIMISNIQVPDEINKAHRRISRIGNAEFPLNLPFQLPPEGSRLRRDAYLVLSNFIQDKLTLDDAASQIQEIMLKAVPEVMEQYGLQPEELDYPEKRPRL